MSLSAFDDILSCSRQSDPQKEESEKAVAEAKDKLDAIATVVPDDKEDLREEQAYWCGQWHMTLVRGGLVAMVSCAHNNDRERSISPLLRRRNSDSLLGWTTHLKRRCERRMPCSGNGREKARCDRSLNGKRRRTRGPSERHEVFKMTKER